MASPTSLTCEKLRDAFEGREAIYIEKGVLRVRVTSIRCYARQLGATVDEVPTKGLERSLLHRGQVTEPTAPLRWNISAGCLATFSDHTLKMGYGGWSLLFAPEVVSAFVSLAADWPTELGAAERYNPRVG
jgi:hypothetical protein